ncbi:pyruvate dehydrogenase (quinone)/pyruvate oxidase/pyruvate decarboxylase [Larkinella arboricola]|uniref:Pyruvate dehydrogenase (Quinone)/pyruvate oxidase/pyruvate decarboxylase n=1 Tax=Larkinella arboricola TaxID=643671 RepID=A0A327XA51_LARAB|nr:thiamine pyrophosphate-dependent enzyme [Larkinella arboricola]RAK00557.1 pyruvate dehydrogenase (quinone)/pyruvate oxidase/pyruvate decarboxylase [Larkinella arboricola]
METEQLVQTAQTGVMTTADPAQTTADILIDKLIAWQVEVVFGLIGDGINPIMEALRKRQDKIKFIAVRHEEAGAFMAAGYAKYTGKLGVCLGTSGPGAVHLMNGLWDAAMENTPVLAITGAPFHDLLGTQYVQEVDTVSMVKDIAVYNVMINGPQQAQTVVDLACRTALTTPGVAHLAIAKDIQKKPLSEDKASKDGENLRASSTYMPRIETPVTGELDATAALLNAGNKVMILAGRGALAARAEVEQVAEKLGAPVAKALLGKALLPDDSPYTTGGIGHLGTLPSKQMMEECDTLLILGSNMPYVDFYPKDGRARAVQIDRDPKRIGLRYPVEIGINGDVQATLKALLPKLQAKTDRSFLQLAQQRMADWRKTIAQVENEDAKLIKPQFLVAEVSRLLNDDAVIAIDTGAHTVFTARHWQIRPNQKVAVSGNLATMAPGLPYTIAAQLAYPGRQCVAMVGDGGFTMLMGEMVTAVRYNLPVKVVVFKNNSLSMDYYEQEALGYPVYGADLTSIDFAKVAEACGAEGYRCTQKDEVTSTLTSAFASNRPAVIEVLVDPDQAPAAPDKVAQNKFE